MSLPQNALPRWLLAWPIHVLLIALAVALVYGHTLDVPFYLDDFSSIRENPLIYHWQGFGSLWAMAPMRFVGYLTIAMNYALDQFAPWGYHLVNTLIHVLAGAAAHGLTRGILASPWMKDRVSPLARDWLPLLVALLFVLHPLQTQAVTYIIQRLASLAALFYLATLAAYIQGRLAVIAGQFSRAWLWFGLGLIAAILAVFTKQNTVTLPLAVLLVELVFFSQQPKRLALVSLATLAGLVATWAVLAFGVGYQPFSLAAMEAATRETHEISRATYLATQMEVLWVYLQLFFWPNGLHIDHDFPLAPGFGNASVLLAMVGHGVLLALAVFFLRRLPPLAFGILFYYLAHAVESSVIPIRDVLFEHRAYLPNFGLCLALGWALLDPLPKIMGDKTEGRDMALGLVAMLLVTLSVVAWQRNQTWRDPVALWQNNVELAPNKPRAWSILGKHVLQQAATSQGEARQALAKEAETKLRRAIQLQQARGSDQVNTNDVINLIVAMKIQKRHDEALALTANILAQPLTPFMRAKFLINQGNIFYETRRWRESEQAYRQALAAYPDNLTAQANLASILATTGRIEEAKNLYRQVLTKDPDNQAIRENLQALEQR